MRTRLAIGLGAAVLAHAQLFGATAAAAAPGCLATSTSIITLTGTSRTDFTASRGTGIDARAVNWTTNDPFLVHIDGGPGVCWLGGKILGTWDQENSLWDLYHSTAAMYVYADDTDIEDVRIHNYGDAIRERNPVANWAVRRSYFTDIHDDAFENEDHANLVIEDNLIEGTYVAVSTRNSNTAIDGSNNLITIRSNLISLKAFAHNYKEQPGFQGFFKYDEDGRGPKVSMHDNVVLAVGDKSQNNIPFFPYLNKLDSCSGNKLLYLGTQAQFDYAMAKGAGPDGMRSDKERLANLPAGCFTVTLKPSGVSDAQFLADMGWTKKVSDWKATHIAAGGTPGGGGTTPAVPQAPILLP